MEPVRGRVAGEVTTPSSSARDHSLVTLDRAWGGPKGILLPLAQLAWTFGPAHWGPVSTERLCKKGAESTEDIVSWDVFWG